MESFEIMEFYNKWWNYVTPLFGISISIIVIMMEKVVFH